ncbi:hypothetical protein EST38_g393 [Candolleomyces aberdarensis]|uniref:Nephrocystin 3-like N-terminal domain-containing protein n=1 Tax=Candolleomyces aberdarensis TaxID=2316362 RepID=A0A4Q2DYL3_9AGAR|nr:hypothetical protein EST38_g393 [Candolleomyces aberdarensis]
MAVVIPETEPIIRSAVQGNPGLLRQDEGDISLRVRMQCLVYAPFKAAVQGGTTIEALAQGPLLTVLDGLDECDNKDEVQELIDGMLLFFNENPFIPLRVFITSRVEQHIQSRLSVPGVQLDNLMDHCSDDDIATFLDILFEDGCRRNPIVQAYVHQHGEWPAQGDQRKLVQHIGGSFIFASAVFKFIMGADTEGNHATTPMDRLPLALKMNPGLDGLYAQTLAGSEHLPHFSNIISTIALLEAPLPTSGIAELLGIRTYEVVNVLVNLQAIIQVPGTDDIPVTLCHTSLRDFLTTQSRSGSFFAPPSHHVRLFFCCLECQFKQLQRDPELFIRPTEQIPAAASYALGYSRAHSNDGQSFFQLSECDAAVRLCRAALALQPGTLELIAALANAVHTYANRARSAPHLVEAISLFREALKLQPSRHLDRPELLHNLGSALVNRHMRTGAMADLEDAVSLHREALILRPSPHSDRGLSISCLGNTLLDLYRRVGTIADLEEAISLLREALEIRQSSRQFRSRSFGNLGTAILARYRRTGTTADLEEAISLHREALRHQPPPHPNRLLSLDDLGFAFQDRYLRTGTMADLEDAISIHREYLDLVRFPNPASWRVHNDLGNALLKRFQRAGVMADLEEAISMCREALKHRPIHHPDRLLALKNLGTALLHRYKCTQILADLEEAISLYREALELSPFPHPQRSALLHYLVLSLQSVYVRNRTFSHLQEAISHCEELLVSYYPVGHQRRVVELRSLASLLQLSFDARGNTEDLPRIATLREEASQLAASPMESAT